MWTIEEPAQTPISQTSAMRSSSDTRPLGVFSEIADPLHFSQKAFSVAKIEHPEVLDENGKQKVGGLMDPKMGSGFDADRKESKELSLTCLSYRPQL